MKIEPQLFRTFRYPLSLVFCEQKKKKKTSVTLEKKNPSTKKERTITIQITSNKVKDPLRKVVKN
mgnify:CR=1 FL=1